MYKWVIAAVLCCCLNLQCKGRSLGASQVSQLCATCWCVCGQDQDSCLAKIKIYSGSKDKEVLDPLVDYENRCWWVASASWRHMTLPLVKANYLCGQYNYDLASFPVFFLLWGILWKLALNLEFVFMSVLCLLYWVEYTRLSSLCNRSEPAFQISCFCRCSVA